MRGVRVGGPIVVIVIGLIFALAITGEIPGVDLNMIGWIVAVAGVLWIVLDVTLNRSHTSVTEVKESRDRKGARVRREERREGP